MQSLSKASNQWSYGISGMSAVKQSGGCHSASPGRDPNGYSQPALHSTTRSQQFLSRCILRTLSVKCHHRMEKPPSAQVSRTEPSSPHPHVSRHQSVLLTGCHPACRQVLGGKWMKEKMSNRCRLVLEVPCALEELEGAEFQLSEPNRARGGPGEVHCPTGSALVPCGLRGRRSVHQHL